MILMSSRKEAKKARREKRKRRQLEGQRHRFEPAPSVPPAISVPLELVSAAAGREKMSVVLEEFARPFLEEANFETEKGIHNLLNFAVAAWNIALLPEDKQQETLDRAVAKLPEDVQSDVRPL